MVIKQDHYQLLKNMALSLNLIYKLASSVIVSRLKKVLHKLIHEDQKGFIAGRFIGENITLIYDVLL